jgi:diaminopimelate epimerase
MKFTKMQGIGNDYVYINCFREIVRNPEELARKVSDRHFGIGSDGLILIRPCKEAACEMVMYNADGSRGAMCGNGIRCVGKYVYDHGIVDRTKITVLTGSGLRTLDMQTENGKVVSATVDMGKPELTSAVDEEILVNGKAWNFTGISMGNPHAVVFLDEVSSLNLPEIGPGFENHPRFPDRTNTEFVRVIDRGHLEMRVWERGSGETLACGTGACASAAAAVLKGLADDQVDIALLGGHLGITWDRDKDTLLMTGPAVEVFSGEYPDC